MKKITLMLMIMLGMSMASFANEGLKLINNKEVFTVAKMEEPKPCKSVSFAYSNCPQGDPVLIAVTTVTYNCETQKVISATTSYTGYTCAKKSTLIDDGGDPGPLQP